MLATVSDEFTGIIRAITSNEAVNQSPDQTVAAVPRPSDQAPSHPPIEFASTALQPIAEHITESDLGNAEQQPFTCGLRYFEAVYTTISMEHVDWHPVELKPSTMSHEVERESTTSQIVVAAPSTESTTSYGVKMEQSITSQKVVAAPSAKSVTSHGVEREQSTTSQKVVAAPSVKSITSHGVEREQSTTSQKVVAAPSAKSITSHGVEREQSTTSQKVVAAPSAKSITSHGVEREQSTTSQKVVAAPSAESIMSHGVEREQSTTSQKVVAAPSAKSITSHGVEREQSTTSQKVVAAPSAKSITSHGVEREQSTTSQKVVAAPSAESIMSHGVEREQSTTSQKVVAAPSAESTTSHGVEREQSTTSQKVVAAPSAESITSHGVEREQSTTSQKVVAAPSAESITSHGVEREQSTTSQKVVAAPSAKSITSHGVEREQSTTSQKVVAAPSAKSITSHGVEREQSTTSQKVVAAPSAESIMSHGVEREQSTTSQKVVAAPSAESTTSHGVEREQSTTSQKVVAAPSAESITSHGVEREQSTTSQKVVAAPSAESITSHGVEREQSTTSQKVVATSSAESIMSHGVEREQSTKSLRIAAAPTTELHPNISETLPYCEQRSLEDMYVAIKSILGLDEPPTSANQERTGQRDDTSVVAKVVAAPSAKSITSRGVEREQSTTSQNDVVAPSAKSIMSHGVEREQSATSQNVVATSSAESTTSHGVETELELTSSPSDYTPVTQTTSHGVEREESTTSHRVVAPSSAESMTSHGVETELELTSSPSDYPPVTQTTSHGVEREESTTSHRVVAPSSAESMTSHGVETELELTSSPSDYPPVTQTTSHGVEREESTTSHRIVAPSSAESMTSHGVETELELTSSPSDYPPVTQTTSHGVEREESTTSHRVVATSSAESTTSHGVETELELTSSPSDDTPVTPTPSHGVEREQSTTSQTVIAASSAESTTSHGVEKEQSTTSQTVIAAPSAESTTSHGVEREQSTTSQNVVAAPSAKSITSHGVEREQSTTSQKVVAASSAESTTSHGVEKEQSTTSQTVIAAPSAESITSHGVEREQSTTSQKVVAAPSSKSIMSHGVEREQSTTSLRIAAAPSTELHPNISETLPYCEQRSLEDMYVAIKSMLGLDEPPTSANQEMTGQRDDTSVISKESFGKEITLTAEQSATSCEAISDMPKTNQESTPDGSGKWNPAATDSSLHKTQPRRSGRYKRLCSKCGGIIKKKKKQHSTSARQDLTKRTSDDKNTFETSIDAMLPASVSDWDKLKPSTTSHEVENEQSTTSQEVDETSSAESTAESSTSHGVETEQESTSSPSDNVGDIDAVIKSILGLDEPPSSERQETLKPNELTATHSVTAKQSVKSREAISDKPKTNVCHKRLCNKCGGTKKTKQPSTSAQQDRTKPMSDNKSILATSTDAVLSVLYDPGIQFASSPSERAAPTIHDKSTVKVTGSNFDVNKDASTSKQQEKEQELQLTTSPAEYTPVTPTTSHGVEMEHSTTSLVLAVLSSVLHPETPETRPYMEQCYRSVEDIPAAITAYLGPDEAPTKAHQERTKHILSTSATEGGRQSSNSNRDELDVKGTPSLTERTSCTIGIQKMLSCVDVQEEADPSTSQATDPEPPSTVRKPKAPSRATEPDEPSTATDSSLHKTRKRPEQPKGRCLQLKRLCHMCGGVKKNNKQPLTGAQKERSKSTSSGSRESSTSTVQEKQVKSSASPLEKTPRRIIDTAASGEVLSDFNSREDVVTSKSQTKGQGMKCTASSVDTTYSSVLDKSKIADMLRDLASQDDLVHKHRPTLPRLSRHAGSAHEHINTTRARHMSTTARGRTMMDTCKDSSVDINRKVSNDISFGTHNTQTNNEAILERRHTQNHAWGGQFLYSQRDNVMPLAELKYDEIPDDVGNRAITSLTSAVSATRGESSAAFISDEFGGSTRTCCIEGSTHDARRQYTPLSSDVNSGLFCSTPDHHRTSINSQKNDTEFVYSKRDHSMPLAEPMQYNQRTDDQSSQSEDSVGAAESKATVFTARIDYSTSSSQKGSSTSTANTIAGESHGRARVLVRSTPDHRSANIKNGKNDFVFVYSKRDHSITLAEHMNNNDVAEDASGQSVNNQRVHSLPLAESMHGLCPDCDERSVIDTIPGTGTNVDDVRQPTFIFNLEDFSNRSPACCSVDHSSDTQSICYSIRDDLSENGQTDDPGPTTRDVRRTTVLTPTQIDTGTRVDTVFGDKTGSPLDVFTKTVPGDKTRSIPAVFTMAVPGDSTKRSWGSLSLPERLSKRQRLCSDPSLDLRRGVDSNEHWTRTSTVRDFGNIKKSAGKVTSAKAKNKPSERTDVSVELTSRETTSGNSDVTAIIQPRHQHNLTDGGVTMQPRHQQYQTIPKVTLSRPSTDQVWSKPTQQCPSRTSVTSEMRSAATGLDSSVTGNVATLLRDLGPESSREDIGETANRVLRQMHQVCP